MRDALAHLPHGPEFRFIDCITELEPGKSGRGRYQVRGDEAFLRGHFPGEPIFPGVLLIEAAAQLGGCVGQSDAQVQPLRGLKLAAVGKAKINGSARPGETIELWARVIGRMGGLIQIAAEASVAGKIVLQTELTLAGEGG